LIPLTDQLKSFRLLKGELLGSQIRRPSTSINEDDGEYDPLTLSFFDTQAETEYSIARFGKKEIEKLCRVYLLLSLLFFAGGVVRYVGTEGDRQQILPLVASLSAAGYLLLVTCVAHCRQQRMAWQNVQRVVLFSALVIAGAVLAPLQIRDLETAADVQRYNFELGLRSIVFKSVGCSLLLLSSARFLLVAALETGYFLSLHWTKKAFVEMRFAVAVSVVATLCFYFIARQQERKERLLFLTTGRAILTTTALEKEVKMLNFLKKTLTLGHKSKGKKKHQVMISYSHKNSDIAFALEKGLSETGLFEVWVDREGIQAGSDWRGQIAEAIQASVCVIFLVSKPSVSSRYCQEEIYFAKVVGVPILPLAIQANMFGQLGGGLKMILQRIQWIDFTTAIQNHGGGEQTAGGAAEERGTGGAGGALEGDIHSKDTHSKDLVAEQQDGTDVKLMLNQAVFEALLQKVLVHLSGLAANNRFQKEEEVVITKKGEHNGKQGVVLDNNMEASRIKVAIVGSEECVYCSPSDLQHKKEDKRASTMHYTRNHGVQQKLPPTREGPVSLAVLSWKEVRGWTHSRKRTKL
jgi:hypothetical protein